MKIVIDIPEENYEVTLTKIMLDCRGCKITEIVKKHGRLIDADALIEQIKKSKCIDCNSINGVRCRACQYDDEMADIDDAPTIIEADKECEK